MVFAETANGTLKKGTYELLSAARGKGHDVKVAAFGPGADQLGVQLAGWDVKEIVACTDDRLSQYNPQLFSRVAAEISNGERPFLVLASASMQARDLFPRVAALVGAGIASDCTEFAI